MNNFKILLLHEFLRQVKSFKFALIVGLSLIVTIFTVYLQVIDFKERLQNCEEEELEVLNEAKKAGTFAELHVPIVISPNPLSIFSKGFDEKAGNKINISVEDIPVLETVEQKKNPFMAIFMNFDIVSIVKIVLSLMAIYLIADSISGEREDQTLKMIFVNQVSRLDFFMAKYFAALIVITIPLLVIFLFSSLYILLQHSIQLSGIFWLRLALIFLSSLAFLSVFIFIGLWISIKVPSSAQAMIYGLFVWIAVIFIYPNLVNYFISKLVDIPSSEKLESNIEQIYDEFGDELIEDYEKYYPKGKRYFQNMLISSSISFFKNNRYVDLPFKKGITSKFKLEYDAGQVKRMIPLLLEYQNKILDIHNDYQEQQLKQKKIASWSQVITPGYLLDEIAESLAGTSYNNRVRSVEKKARQYRSIYIDYIKSKDGFGSKYFTQIPKDIWSDNREDYDLVAHIYNSSENYPQLNLNDIPEFPSIDKFSPPFELIFLLLLNLVLLLIVNRNFNSLIVIKD